MFNVSVKVFLYVWSIVRTGDIFYVYFCCFISNQLVLQFPYLLGYFCFLSSTEQHTEEDIIGYPDLVAGGKGDKVWPIVMDFTQPPFLSPFDLVGCCWMEFQGPQACRSRCYLYISLVNYNFHKINILVHLFDMYFFLIYLLIICIKVTSTHFGILK